ncbi:S53 family peptidase [Haliangium ochraceum]|uniref:Protease-like protein n=1 Tax=Haliangium ochraceum (strain DSM 14365 / JCM 11303 / SMP-2) TaxID=502025 RepID=D0LUE6_HALO1|nr:S53 family peptidase [Haliangium ochraceum]ACY19269.1 protease-like protein [Haliangium ochraceum DSM 14365]
MNEVGNNVLTVVFNEKGAADIYGLALRVSDPGSSDYGKYVSRSTLKQMAAPSHTARQRCEEWFEQHNMHIFERPTPQIILAEATDEELNKAFGPDYSAWLKGASSGGAPRGLWGLPTEIAGVIKAIHLHTVDSPGELSLLSHGIPSARTPDTMDDAERAPVASEEGVPQSVGGFSVADVRQIYEFPDDWDGSGETIALLNLAGRPSVQDLQAFWRANGVERADPEHVLIGGARDEHQGFVARLEATMGAAWIGAMAPGARLVIYDINPEMVADPWATMVAVAVADTEREPSILVSTWTTPETDYYRDNGSRVFSDLMRQATALGITMVVASGDWGVYSGRPNVRRGHRKAVAAAWPQGVFPAVEDQVLAVGGTMITSREPLTEVAWSGPLPPNRTLRESMPFRLFATSGGFSEQVPLPVWQNKHIPYSRAFSRGANLPAVTPYGRGYPDVALMAAGPAVQLMPGAQLSSVGYQLVMDGRWINYAGGTSMSAPVWATIIACMNQARRAKGKSRLGFVNPLLYDLAKKLQATPEKNPFRDITSGNSDVILDAVFQEGIAQRYCLHGYDAQGDWDPVTGLGVPRVDRLIELISS